ncbi:hypothetical protein HRbin03_00416 [archaeon HR03]|uniref:Uncharacterized protein n=1 Tax=Caldiarchaeum subterraneum TaxID=311458 RepID=E6N3N5_CALS0|nr:hypothetical protein HGMM_F37B02C24 [Candidatus Caldarchaeum subterraneum]GBC72585.1 hypothetical protein HRbin03_00416 [archaeon HR03]
MNTESRQKSASFSGADLKKCLELQVGKTGEVNTEYGGFEIVVREPAYFPWHDCFTTLLKYGYEVWVTKKKEDIVIVAKPKAD